jgi:3-demethoxyubiquinol 3-hydroxylase
VAHVLRNLRFAKAMRSWALRRTVSHLATPAHSAVDVSAAREQLQRFVQTASPAQTRWLLGEMASDHAGETGAVFIYRGAQAALRESDPEARAFVAEHLAAEEAHLAYFEALLAHEHRSALLPAWRAAGYALGWLPTAVGGSRWLYATVESVETFVEKHYAEQTCDDQLRIQCPDLVALLEACAQDEVHHKVDAAGRAGDTVRCSFVGRIWSAVVGGGSQAAVALARRV